MYLKLSTKVPTVKHPLTLSTLPYTLETFHHDLQHTSAYTFIPPCSFQYKHILILFTQYNEIYCIISYIVMLWKILNIKIKHIVGMEAAIMYLYTDITKIIVTIMLHSGGSFLCLQVHWGSTSHLCWAGLAGFKLGYHKQGVILAHRQLREEPLLT